MGRSRNRGGILNWFRSLRLLTHLSPAQKTELGRFPNTETCVEMLQHLDIVDVRDAAPVNSVARPTA